MDKITIIKDKGTPVEQSTELETAGFLLVYADGAKMKVTGSLDLKVFAPLIPMIMKSLGDKMGG